VRLSTPAAAAALLLAVVPTPAPAQHDGNLLERYDFERRTGRFDLPGRLDEISGLAITPDGRLFGHDDERALLHEIDPVEGSVGKRFSAGDPPLAGDFEGVAIVGERFFLVTSTGLLYELREAEDRTPAPYRVSDTGLGSRCEVEGLDYDPADDVLLVACKATRPERGVLVVHRLPMDASRDPLPSIEVPRSDLELAGIDADFAPSAIAVDPTGTLVLVSALTESVIEIDRTGRVLAARRLSRDWHPQPEGLAFGPDGTLYIADEKNGQDPRITIYARVRAGRTER